MERVTILPEDSSPQKPDRSDKAACGPVIVIDNASGQPDAADPLQFAIVHDLCQDTHGGTGFFRHRATGFEMLTPERVASYNAALDRELAMPLPPDGHAAQDHPLFALTASCPAAIDRLVLYRSSRLHGALANTPVDGALDPKMGRLTANLFLQCVSVTLTEFQRTAHIVPTRHRQNVSQVDKINI